MDRKQFHESITNYVVRDGSFKAVRDVYTCKILPERGPKTAGKVETENTPNLRMLLSGRYSSSRSGQADRPCRFFQAEWN